jgi:hypothetical protein
MMEVKENPFAGGNGTKSDPFQIKTLEQLKHVKEYQDCYFIQKNDIDGMNGALTEPLFGTFNGVYDGGGYTISNLNCATTSLFGDLSEDGTIKNVNLKNIYIRGQYPAGIVNSNNGRIENCTLTGMRIENTVAIYISGAFCKINGKTGIITQCKVKDSRLYSNTMLENYGIMEYCTVENVTFEVDGWRSAGLVTYNYGTLDHCQVSGLSSDSPIFCMENAEGAVISNCISSNNPVDSVLVIGNSGIVF